MPAAARTATRAFLFVEHTGPRTEDGAYTPRSGPMLDEVLHELRAAIRSCGGRELDGTSDSLPAVFDAASTALLCAHAMRRRVAALPADVAVRVGLHCGEPIEVEGGRFFGSAMWTAARLCGRAGADEILLSTAIEELLPGELATPLVPSGSVNLKGLSAPIAVLTAPPLDPTPRLDPLPRRIVSVLTVDQVGSTALIDAHGDAGARTVHRALLDVIGEAVEDQGGSAFEYGGDGMSVWFPSALDAAQSAVLMQQLAHRHRRAFRGGGALHIRIAIVTGEAEGTTPQALAPLAVRAGALGKRTATDEVLLDPVAHHLVAARRILATVDPGSVEAAASGARAVDWAPSSSSFAIPPALAQPGTFVGRTPELERLHGLWQESRSGAQRVALIDGDAGIGKTALAARLAWRIGQDAGDEHEPAVLYGRCAELPAHPYEALTEALSGSVAATSRADLRRSLGDHAALLAKALPTLRTRLPELGPPPSLGAAAEPVAMARAVSALLDGVTSAAPTLLVLDDLHLAPDELLTVVRELLGGPSPRPLLILGLLRSPDFGPSPVLTALVGRSLAPTGVVELTLRGLGRRDVEALITAVLQDEPPEEVVRTIAAESEGVPYFVLELARARLQAGTEHRLQRAIDRVEAWRLDIRDVRDQVAEDVRRLHRLRGEGADEAGRGDAGPPRLDPEGTPPLAGPNPYRGLASFQPDDADWFFGREQLTAELVAHVAVAGVLAVIGPSGSGKSSLVHAGLLPALAGGAVPGSAGWGVARMTPGAAPRQALAAALEGLLPGGGLEVRRRLATEGLASVAADVSRERGRLLLVLDQAEELFTAATEDERDAFVEVLLTLLDAPMARVNLVLVARADYYGAWAAYPALAALLERDHVLVGAMRDEEIRRAIEGPAAKAGLVVEPDLTETLVADISGEPGALPLLSTALSETWLRRRGRSLTLTAYAETGGVRRAIATMADEVHERLTAAQRTIARRMLLRLARPSDQQGAPDLRRRARLDELTGDDPEAAQVLAVLVDARLVTTDDTTAEVAHEALLREWPLLREWLAEDREGRALHQRLSDAAFEWRQRGQDPELLYRGARLAAAEELAERHPHDLNRPEREFIDAGRRVATDELSRARRTAARLRRLTVGLVGVLVLAVAAGGLAVVQGNAAGERAVTARASSLAAQSATLLDSQQDLGNLLAAAADSLRPSGESKAAVLAAANRTPELVGITPLGSSAQTVSTVSADGSVAAAEDARGVVTVFALPSGKRIRTFTSSAGTGSGASTADPPSLSPSGRFIAIRQGVQHGEAVFEVRTGHLVARLPKVEGVSLPLDTTAVYSDFSTGSPGHTYLDLEAGQPHGFSELHLGEQVQIAGSSQADVLAVGNPEHDPARISLRDLSNVHRSFSQIPGALLAVSPDGKLVAVLHGFPEKVMVVDTTTGRVISSAPAALGEQPLDRPIAAFDARSERLAFMGLESGTPVHVLDVRTGAQSTLAVPIPHTRIPPAFARSDGTLIVVGQHAIARYRLMRSAALRTSRTPRRQTVDVPRALLAADRSGRRLVRVVESPSADWRAMRYRFLAEEGLRPGPTLAPPPGTFFDGRTAAFNSTGRLLATVEIDAKQNQTAMATVWDVASGRALETVGPFPVVFRGASTSSPILPPLTTTIAFTPSGRSLAVLTSTSADEVSRVSATELRLWDLGDRRETAQVSLGGVVWGGLVASGSVAVTVDRHGHAVRWDLEHPGRRHDLRKLLPDPVSQAGAPGDLAVPAGGTGAVLAVPDPKSLGSRSIVARWTARGRDASRAFGVPGSVLDAGYWAVSPDARTVAVDTGGGIDVWSTVTGKRVRTVPESSANAQLLGFTRDGSALAVWDAGVLRVADVATGTAATLGSPLPAPAADVVDDDPDALSTRAGLVTSIVSGDVQVLQRFVLAPAEARTRVCTLAGRNLTRQEWARYIPDVPYRRLCPQWPVPAR